MAKQWNVLDWPSQSPDLNPSNHMVQLLRTRLKEKRPRNKEKVKIAVVQVRQTIDSGDTKGDC